MWKEAKVSLFYMTIVCAEITGLKQVFKLRREFCKVIGFKVKI